MPNPTAQICQKIGKVVSKPTEVNQVSWTKVTVNLFLVVTVLQSKASVCQAIPAFFVKLANQVSTNTTTVMENVYLAKTSLITLNTLNSAKTHQSVNMSATTCLNHPKLTKIASTLYPSRFKGSVVLSHSSVYLVFSY